MPQTAIVHPNEFVVCVDKGHKDERVAMLVQVPVLAARVWRLLDLVVLGI